MKIKINKNIWIVGLIIGVLFVLYFQYSYTKQNLIRAQINKDISRSFLIRDKFKSIINNAEFEFRINLNSNINALKDVYTLYKNIKTFNPNNIAQLLNKKYPGIGKYEVFVIDRNYKIVKSSCKHNRYNLWMFPTFKEVLSKIFNGKQKTNISYIHLDITSLNLKRYFSILSPDKKYILQVVYVVDMYPKVQEEYYKLKANFKELKDIKIYFIDKYFIYPINLEKRCLKHFSLNSLNKLSFNIFEKFLKDVNEYPKYKHILKTANLALIGKTILKIFVEHNGVITKVDLKHHRIEIYTLISSVFNNFTNKLIIKNIFSTKELETSLELLKLRFLLFLSALLVMILFFKYLIFYISKKLRKLIDSMKANQKIEKTNSFIEEIDELINTYNSYRDKLNKEIKKNEELLEENKRFVVDTIHQIKTPLSIIALNSDFMKMQVKNKFLLESLEEIDAAISMLTHSYDDLSYLASEKVVNYKPSEIDFSSLLKERIKFFSVLSKAREKKLIIDIEDNVIVKINKVELERIIDNNISNAIDYSKGKDIYIELKKRDGFAIFKIASFGDKIKDTKKIFEKNYREQEHKKGIGVGLNIVKTICEKYNIKYRVYYQNGQNIFEYKFVTIT